MFTSAADPPPVGPSQIFISLKNLLAWSFSEIDQLRGIACKVGEIAEYIGWQKETFKASNVCASREKLWEEIALKLDGSRPLTVLEFGVAHGYATSWWIRRLRDRNMIWHGFDRFTGLPRAWRDYPEGAFDAGGRPPDIDDSRVKWHVGAVEETLESLDLERSEETQWFIIFDLDIYEPTAFAWEVIRKHLKSGDILYFDEAVDNDERRVIVDLVLPSTKCESIGTTAFGLGLTVGQLLQN